MLLFLGGGFCVAAAQQEPRLSMRAGIATAREHAKSLKLLTGYNADAGDCGETLLGPLPQGRYTGKEAWLKLVEPVCPLLRAEGETEVYADMSVCKCDFGLPRRTSLQQAHVWVTESSLPALDEYVASPVLVMGRRRIEETGAASVPDLLQYFSQTAFHRAPGYRASSAQYAELRGLGAAYTLVMVNGRRAYGTAADLALSAFDLANIPVSAVERIEISMDANSLVHGMDAIGGIVNIVLKDDAEPNIAVRYGSANDGAALSQASISGGAHNEQGRLAVFFDVQQTDELIGRERNRWNDQDYTRFVGPDYRSQFAAPANIRSLDGQNLPGLDAPFAAAELNPATGTFDFIGGRSNRTSLRAFQAIVPQGMRATLAANGSMKLGRSVLSMELLAVRRENELQLPPALVTGYTLGAGHPDNPFDVPVSVDALLTGLRAPRQQFEMSTRRGVAAIEGPLGAWEYSAFVVQSDEQATAQMRNAMDSGALARALLASDDGQALSLYSTVQRTAIPADLYVTSPVQRYSFGATHLQASARGSLLQLTPGDWVANVGGEYRHEREDFDTRVENISRDISSTFAHLRVPLVGPAMAIAGVERLQLLLGARRDDYSDIGAITKSQLGLIWNVTAALQFHASTSGAFRPPSLVELYFPRTTFTTQIFDARRNEAVPVELTTGGNADLQPTTGRMTSVGASWQAAENLRLSADVWRVKVRNHIALLAPMALLAHEDSALAGRVRRAQDAQGPDPSQRGRLLSLDISRANVGGAATRGVDLMAEATIDTRLGSFTPRILATLTDKFEYSDLPITRLQLEDRVGVAAEAGTIPAQRAVASLTYESDQWRASLHARVISSYRDRSATTGEPIQRSVAGGAQWDFNISRRIVGNLRVTLGAFNLTNREPPYAEIGGPLGFDASQGDLKGREIFATLGGNF